MLNALWNGTMDGRLKELVTFLNKVNANGVTDMQIIEEALGTDKVLRKYFWEYRLKFIKDVQNFASQFQTGAKDWEKMDEADRMHVRLYALLYGGPRNWTNDGQNLIWRAAQRVVDLSKDANSVSALPAMMNSMSSPENHLRKQIDKARERKNATDPISVSLAWSTTDDMDLWACDANNNRCGYLNLVSGNMILKFDANAFSR